MPVRLSEVIIRKQVYLTSCEDCKDWCNTFVLKRNADLSMLGHRILKHGYTPSLSVLTMLRERHGMES